MRSEGFIMIRRRVLGLKKGVYALEKVKQGQKMDFIHLEGDFMHRNES